MKKRIVIELFIFTVIWTIFVYVYLFPEAKRYLSTKNPKWKERLTSTKIKTLKKDIEITKKEKAFLRKKIFPLHEALCKEKAANDIISSVNSEAVKKNITVSKLHFSKTLSNKLGSQDVYQLNIDLHLVCTYKNFLDYLDLLQESALFFKIKSLDMEYNPDDYETLVINLTLNTFCI